MGTIRVAFAIAHASFDATRRAHLPAILAHLKGEIVKVIEDDVGVGSLEPWKASMLAAADHEGVTHVVFLPDDAQLHGQYVRQVREVIEAAPDAVACGMVNVDRPEAKWPGYWTSDGCTLHSGIFPVAALREALAWRERHLLNPSLSHRDGGVAGDEGVNLWAMATGRRILKPVPSLIDHAPLRSLDGNEHQDQARTVHRQAVVPPDPDASWRGVDFGKAPFIGRTYRGNHWRLVTDTAAGPVWLEKAFEVERGGPVHSAPSVLLTTPVYGGEARVEFFSAVYAEAAALSSAGIKAGITSSDGDSLVQRGRNELVWRFLCGPFTHLLFWDSDVVPLRAGYVAEMLAKGHDIIGGAYPYRAGTPRVVASFHGAELTMVDDCIDALDVPTGFMLISRRALLAMARRYWSEMFYRSDNRDEFGAPRLAFFDCGIRDGRYLSEDYLFCRRWQQMGGRTYLYAPADFEHYGHVAHRASLMEQFR